MSMGLEIRNRFGTVVFTSERPYGGCYVGTYTLPSNYANATWRFDGSDPAFPNLTGSTLRVVMVGAGPHNYEYGNNVITLTKRPYIATTTRDYTTQLMVFAA